MKQKNNILKSNQLHYILILILLLLTSCISSSKKYSNYDYYPIKKVVDGDTFWIDDGSEKGTKVRLIGVDTPEINHTQKPVEHFGAEASEYVKELLEGKLVRLEYDVGKYDRYKRVLAYVYLEDGTFLNAHLLKKGYARIMTIPPNVKHAEYFLKLEKTARRKKKGMWEKMPVK